MKGNEMRLLLLALAALLFVSACGKKAPLRPPSPEEPDTSFVG
jgi:predicted small lipoprotein YifL